MRRRHEEEHTNHEAWAIPYGDLITLLLAFFVVMYAVSSLNEGKYRLLSDALTAEFRGVPRSIRPIQIGERTRGDGTDNSLVALQQKLSREQPKPLHDDNGAGPAPIPSPVEAIDPIQVQIPQTPAAQAAAKTAAALDGVAHDVEQAMTTLIRENVVAVRRHGLWVEVEIKTDILFASGSSTLSPLAVSVLEQLAEVIKPFDNPVRVEGHTDNVPINTVAFPSYWELSAARAASVVHLFTKRGFDPKRLTVIGLGDQRPLKSNDTAEGRDANRRVVLVILGTDNSPEGSYSYERERGESSTGAADGHNPVQTAQIIETRKAIK
jgi:chemotaxis protein MotB